MNPLRVNDPSEPVCEDWRCIGHGWHHPGPHQQPLSAGMRDIEIAINCWVITEMCRAWLQDQGGAWSLRIEMEADGYCATIFEDAWNDLMLRFTTSKPSLFECLTEAHEWMNTR